MIRIAVSFYLPYHRNCRRPCKSFRRQLFFLRTLTFKTTGLSNASTMSQDPTSISVHIHPFDRKDIESIEKDANKKSLHFIRHAQGFHNVNKRYRDYQNLDARLTDYGLQQCHTLSRELQSTGLLHSSSDILIVTSPLTRCLQTTMYSLDSLLKDKRPPIVALESVRETVNYNCDRRRSISELSMEFPMVDFGHIESDPDPIWDHYERQLGDDCDYTLHRESAELHVVADRGRDFFQWLARQPQSHVLVCTHSAFLRCIKNYGYGVPHKPEQLLDDRTVPDKEDRPVLHYSNEAHGSSMKAEYANCELRSMTASFVHDGRIV